MTDSIKHYFWKRNLINKIISNANHYDDDWVTVN